MECSPLEHVAVVMNQTTNTMAYVGYRAETNTVVIGFRGVMPDSELNRVQTMKLNVRNSPEASESDSRPPSTHADPGGFSMLPSAGSVRWERARRQGAPGIHGDVSLDPHPALQGTAMTPRYALSRLVPFLTLTSSILDCCLFKTLRQVLSKVTTLENAFDGAIPTQ